MSFQWNPSGLIHTSAAQSKSASALLAPGELDPTFGEGGLVTTDMNRNSYGNAVALQPDGKIVLAGKVATTMDVIGGAASAKYDFALSRYNSDGSLDATFGTNGMVTTDFADSDDVAYAVALQDDGKIIAAGTSYKYGFDCALARYDNHGSLDTSFGTGGKATVYFERECYAMALQSDGKIIVAGSVPNETVENNNGFELARFDSDGSLDITFGDNGIVKTYCDSYLLIGYAVTVQSDGKIVLAGSGSSSFGFADPEFALARYNNDGSLDISFGTNGIVITAFGGANIGLAVTIQKDSMIIIAGGSRTGTSVDVALVRFNSEGSLDTTFGTNGEIVTDFGGGDIARAITLREDNKIVAAGDSDGNFILAGYNNDGSLDISFGTDGKVLTDFSGCVYGCAGTLQPDGKFVLIGSTYDQFNYNIVLARYNSNGSPDTTFGTDGEVITKFGGSFDYGYATALQTDGKTLVAGASSGGYDFVFSLSRYNLNGSLDDTFGNNGITLTRPGGKSSQAYAVAIQPDEKIVVAGGSGGPLIVDFALARYNSNGSLDTSFGSSGVIITDFATHPDGGNAVALQSDGKIVVAGWTVNFDNGMNYDFALARYDNNGSLDPTFGNGGKVTTDFNGFTDIAHAIVLQPDQKIVVAGSMQVNTGAGVDFALVRYNEDGTLDSTFGADGKVTTDFGGSDFARAMTLQEDGKFVVAGDSDGHSILARYNSDGSLDTSFGNGGVATGSLGNSTKGSVNSSGIDHGRAVVVQSDGKIIVGGDSNNEFALARYNNDGTLDTTFGTSGRTTTDFGGSDNECRALAVQPDGKVVAAGYANKNINYDFAAARYFTTSEPIKIYLPLVLLQFP